MALFTIDRLSAQELEMAAPEEAQPAIPEDVLRQALVDLISEESADPADAKTTADPDIALGALDIMLEPLTLDDLMPEIAGWEVLLTEAIENLAASELELFNFNAAKAQADTGEGSGQIRV